MLDDFLYLNINPNSFNQVHGKSLVWEEKIVGAATIVADSRV